jgi:hypothetical protein
MQRRPWLLGLAALPAAAVAVRLPLAVIVVGGLVGAWVTAEFVRRTVPAELRGNRSR